MSDFRKRPQGDFIQQTDWEALYALTKHWRSDLLFYKDDLQFLHHLIDKYFIWITKKDNLEDVQQVGTGILADSKKCTALLEKVDTHLSHLTQLLKEPSNTEAVIFRKEHQELEDEIANFIKTVRANRKELFVVTEHVLESEQLMHLMAK